MAGQILSAQIGDLVISVNSTYVIYNGEGDIAQGVRVEGFVIDGGNTLAVAKTWEVSNPWDAMGNIHVLPVTRFYLSNTVLVLPLDAFMDEFQIVHHTKLKLIHESLRREVSTFSQMRDAAGRLRRVAASKVEIASSKASRSRDLGMKIRKAIATQLRKLNATQGKISLCLPFAKDEVWKLLEENCGNALTKGKSKILRLNHPAHLDRLCGKMWDCHVFGSGAFNVVKCLQLKSCSTDAFTLTFRFKKDNNAFTEASYRQNNPFHH